MALSQKKIPNQNYVSESYFATALKGDYLGWESFLGGNSIVAFNLIVLDNIYIVFSKISFIPARTTTGLMVSSDSINVRGASQK